ncbi:iron-containing redox enzyme family protein [Sinorhizobium meliloti]|nr:iron-containing redox enzyme family protein [Sinorhizobium meliloti]WQP22916.1 iron-containing redox enzyme family protein [Sinorhizobium meliloti]WQP35942.1 iron-containing redox enzyme family protein [Sinorhizobium meliloti]
MTGLQQSTGISSKSHTGVNDFQLAPVHRFLGCMIGQFHFSPAAQPLAEALLAAEPREIAASVLNECESEAMLLAAKQILDATLNLAEWDDGVLEAIIPAPVLRGGRVDREALWRWLEEHRRAAAAALDGVADLGTAATHDLLRGRAALSLLGDCWLDTVSQPATQPGVIVNILFGQRWLLLGEGCLTRSCVAMRRRALEAAGIFLPPISDPGFFRAAAADAMTSLQAAFLLSLSRYPATYLPELVGIHAASHALGIDDRVAGLAPIVTREAAWEALDTYLDALDDDPAGETLSRRLVDAMRVFVCQERRQLAMLVERAGQSTDRPLDQQVAEIIRRHAPFAGKQHRRVRIGGKPLSERLVETDQDLASFLQDFKRSGYLLADAKGSCRFLDAIKFRGPMFGIFSEQEASVLKSWFQSVAQTRDEPVVLEPQGQDEPVARLWLDNIRKRRPRDTVFESATGLDDRTLFYRLVNIENFANTLSVALERARAGLSRAEALFNAEAAGQHTDARFFEYSPDALEARIESIYWKKLVDPYAPLGEIPSRDEVVFGQKYYALGNMVDGAWAYRSSGTRCVERIADTALFAIYADEMGLGDLEKNHITLIYRVLESLGIDLPHIREETFIDQDEIPDEFYTFPLNQLSIGLFPNRLYPEILGYNLGVEMFGLGELRLHEIQKLKHWGFDPIYEAVHLSIDNLSAGHARQALTMIQDHLAETERRYDADTCAVEWRRVWNGYASFAYFVEGGTLESSPSVTTDDDAGADHCALTL